VLRERRAGLAHLAFSWGFLVLTLATVAVFLQHDLGIPILSGNFYLYFQSLAVDLFGFAAIIGVLYVLYQRYVVRPPRLTHGVFSDGVLLVAFPVALIQGYVVEGLRMVATQVPSRSAEHTSELQSRETLVCLLLLYKKTRMRRC